MYVALIFLAAGFLALLFYVVWTVNPKQAEFSAKLWKLAEFTLKAKGDGRGRGKPPRAVTPPESPESKREISP